jgi:alkanesulfonate monooxygenase SsuD/methylene tetrahydromethanopterin reductase-like flavin-dependent oxidoreductase (luciferase family)
MKFGVFLNCSGHRAGVPFHQEMVEQARLLDASGWDYAVVAERHQRVDGRAEALTSMAWLLAHTSRIRVASGGLILPTYHPFRLAEQTAWLDVVSGGRLVLGVVLGYFAGDFAPFGIDRRDRVGRLTEGVEVIRRLWTGERVTFRGRHVTLDGDFISPPPLQKPGPPIWIGAKVEPAIRRAAALGDGWFPSADDGPDVLAGKIAIYREALAAAGKPRGEIVLLRDGFVADSLAAARAIVEGPMLGKYAEYRAWKSASPDADRYAESFEAALPKLVIGSPAQCVDAIGRYAELGVDAIVLRLQYAGTSHADTLRAIERFARDVLPRFAGPARR